MDFFRKKRCTCFTLAAIQRVRAEVSLFAMKEETFSENDRMPESRTTWVSDGQQASDEGMIT